MDELKFYLFNYKTIKEEDSGMDETNPNDPNVDQNSEAPYTEKIQTPEFNNEEIAARINVIQDIEKILSLINKIRSIQTYGTKFNINEFEDMIHEVLNRIDTYTTLDLIEFKDILIKKIKSDLIVIKTGLSEYLDSDLFDKDELFIMENDLSILDDNKIRLNIKKMDEAFIYINNLIRKKIISLDEDDNIKAFGFRIEASKLKLILEDTLNCFNKLYNKKIIDLAHREDIIKEKKDNNEAVLDWIPFVYLYDTPIYSKRNNISLITNKLIKVEKHIESSKNVILLSSLPTEKTIIEYVLILRYCIVQYLLITNKKIKYSDNAQYAIIYIISSMIKKVFKIDNFDTKIIELIDKKKWNKDKLFDSIYNFDSILSNIDIKKFDLNDIETLRKCKAAFKYLSDAQMKEFNSFDNLFVNSFVDGIKKYLELYVSDLESIYVIGDKFDKNSIISSLHVGTFIEPLYNKL